MRKLAVVLVTVLGVGVLVGFQVAPRDDVFFALKKNFEIFAKLYEELAVGYVDDLDPEQVMRTGIAAMLDDLDPYTVFYDEASNVNAFMQSRGGQASVGVQLGMRDGRLTVLVPEETTEAYSQGLRVGDVIETVNGRDVTGLTPRDVAGLLLGDPGTTVDLQVRRTGVDAVLTFVLTRRVAEPKNVSFAGRLPQANGIGYVKLEQFGRAAAVEVHGAIEALLAEGPLDGFVLDLRGNPGGLLNDAVSIAGQFVPTNTVVASMKGRLPETTEVYRTRQAPLLPDVPLVILMDEGSASASEVVAGAVQDLDRGIVVGDVSFGKGLVQVVRALPYNTSLKLTIARYYTPSGRSLQKIRYYTDGATDTVEEARRRTFTTRAGRPVRDASGIEPDVRAVGTPSELEQALRQQAMFFRFANHWAATHPTLPPGFTADDRLLADFRTWLSAQNFTYRTATERTLEAAAQQAADAGYTASAEFDDVRTALDRAKAEAFTTHAEALKAHLRRTLRARYLSTSDLVRAELPDDRVLQRALALLQDPTAYRRTLSARS